MNENECSMTLIIYIYFPIHAEHHLDGVYRALHHCYKDKELPRHELAKMTRVVVALNCQLARWDKKNESLIFVDSLIFEDFLISEDFLIFEDSLILEASFILEDSLIFRSFNQKHWLVTYQFIWIHWWDKATWFLW